LSRASNKLKSRSIATNLVNGTTEVLTVVLIREQTLTRLVVLESRLRLESGLAGLVRRLGLTEVLSRDFKTHIDLDFDFEVCGQVLIKSTSLLII